MNRIFAPARRAARISGTLCAEDVTSPASRPPKSRRPPRKCNPALSRAASRASPATTRPSRRARHSFATRNASAARSGASSCRSTTPDKPGGNRAMAGIGSGARRKSVNSQSTGNRPRRLCFTARAQNSNRASMPGLSPIAQNLASILARIAAAAQNAGRKPEDITLVAVSKTHPPEAIAQALAAGQFTFGENRLQEAQAKFPDLLARHPKTRLHLIGALQTNKAKDAVKLCHMIESLDRPKLADAITTAAAAHGACPDLLIQINIGDEPQKSGIPTADAETFIRFMRTRFGPSLRGLMCIPPAGADPTPYFRHLTALADTHNLPIRSMGMSADFETAIHCGATHVRIGTALFGAR